MTSTRCLIASQPLHTRLRSEAGDAHAGGFPPGMGMYGHMPAAFPSGAPEGGATPGYGWFWGMVGGPGAPGNPAHAPHGKAAASSASQCCCCYADRPLETQMNL